MKGAAPTWRGRLGYYGLAVILWLAIVTLTSWLLGLATGWHLPWLAVLGLALVLPALYGMIDRLIASLQRA